MKKILILFFLLLPGFLFAQDSSPDEIIEEIVSPAARFVSEIIFYAFQVTDEVAIPVILLWLLMGALYFTWYMKFVNLRGFMTAIRITRGQYDDPNDKGEVSHFQALATALSGTVGLGNIAGVAVAIAMGGPGATLWMIFAGFLGMTSKFVECTLGVKYRKVNEDGSVSGGPMYYLSEGLKKRGMGGLGKVLAVFFAIMCIGGSFGGGNMFQGNQAASQIINITGGADTFIPGKFWIGLVLAVLVAIVIIGGVKSIARVTEKIVPFMCGVYALGAIIIIFTHYNQIPDTIYLIVKEAFAPGALKGGVLGVMIQGFRRAVFSNEAGVGSASIAHSAVKTNEPVTEGLVSLLEPFIDTVVVCTMTAFVIIITGTYQDSGDMNGVLLTSRAFSTVIWWFPYILSGAVVLFAFSTMLSWSYYGLKSWTYLFGESKMSDYSYKAIFCVFVVIGASMQLTSVIDFSDAMIFAMSFPNVLGMYIMAPEVKRDLFSFLHRIKTGEIRRHK